jgi:hypothetical protein
VHAIDWSPDSGQFVETIGGAFQPGPAEIVVPATGLLAGHTVLVDTDAGDAAVEVSVTGI